MHTFMFANLLIVNVGKNSQFAINRYSQLKSVLQYFHCKWSELVNMYTIICAYNFKYVGWHVEISERGWISHLLNIDNYGALCTCKLWNYVIQRMYTSSTPMGVPSYYDYCDLKGDHYTFSSQYHQLCWMAVALWTMEGCLESSRCSVVTCAARFICRQEVCGWPGVMRGRS